MQRRPVRSSNVASIGWEPPAGDEQSSVGTLEVEFHSGHINRYRDVPEYEYRQLIGASSVGKWFNQHIKDRFEEERV